MKTKRTLCYLFLVAGSASFASAMTVLQTTNPTALGAVLDGGAGITINSVTINNGASGQFGTYTGFSSLPITLGDGIVMSTGLATQTTASYHSTGNAPASNTGVGSTPEFTNYASGRVANFNSGNDVASLTVHFTLASAGNVKFDWGFGSVEYPQWTSSFTDAFFAFLDGTSTANQIVYDASHNPVQVGSSFASSLITNETNTAFSNPHGFMGLTTTTGSLAAGEHSLTFEIGDVNDHDLDSAVFISALQALQPGEGGGGGDTPLTEELSSIPEPSTWGTMAMLTGAGLLMRRRKVIL